MGEEFKKRATLRYGMPLNAFALGLMTFVILNLAAHLSESFLVRVQMYDLQYGAVRVADYARAPRPDVVFMGSSRALNGFDPAQAEAEINRRAGVPVHALNLGVAGGSIDVNYLILKNIISTDKQPSVIVYGLSEFELYSLTSDDLARQINMPLLERLDDFALYGGKTLDDKVSFVLKRLSPLYRDHELIRSALSIAFNSHDVAHRYYAEQHDLPANGFVALPTSVHASAAAVEQHREEYGYKLSRFHVDPAALARFHAFIALAQSRGIAVVLVNMPVTPEHRALWRSGENVSRYRAVVQGVADAHGIPLIDLYQDPDHVVPTNGFFDYHHLNLTGARVLTNLVTQLSLIDLFRQQKTPRQDAGIALSDLRAPTMIPLGAATGASVTVQGNPRATGVSGLQLEYQWLDTLGYAARQDGPAVPIPISVAPGERRRIDFPISPAPLPGSYILEVDVRDGGARPVGDASATVRQSVTIGTAGPVFASDEFFRATLSQLQVPATMGAGTLGHGSVTIRNDSRDPWPSISISYHWLDGSGRESVHDGRRTSLPKDVRPGQEVRRDFAVEGPPQPGGYILVVDLVYEEVGWFGSHGNPTVRQGVTVGAREAARDAPRAVEAGADCALQ